MHVPSILVVSASVALAPWLANKIGRELVPVVVLELILGIIIGPQGLQWATYNGALPYLSNFGMAFLFFLAGTEIDIAALRGRPLRVGVYSWFASVIISISICFALQQAGLIEAWTLVALIITTTALGIVVPILRDEHQLDTNFGRYVLASGMMGEVGPILVMSLLFVRGGELGQQSLLTLLFILIVLLVFWASLRTRPPGLIKLLAYTMHQSGQWPIRLCMLLLTVMVVLAENFGLDLALGAFAAGMAAGLATRMPATAEAGEKKESVLNHKLDAIGFGFLIPIFFVTSGMKLDIAALAAHPVNFLLILLFAILLLLVRGLPVAWLARKDLQRGELPPLAFYSATSLSLIVAITNIAVERGMMPGEQAAILVGAGLLSVIVFPLLALKK